MQLSSLDHQYQVIPLKVIIELFQANSYFPTKLSQIKSPSIRTVGFFFVVDRIVAALHSVLHFSSQSVKRTHTVTRPFTCAHGWTAGVQGEVCSPPDPSPELKMNGPQGQGPFKHTHTQTYILT